MIRRTFVTDVIEYSKYNGETFKIVGCVDGECIGETLLWHIIFTNGDEIMALEKEVSYGAKASENDSTKNTC